VRRVKSGVSERFVKGNVGMRSSGIAFGFGDLMCRKWILNGIFESGVLIAVRN
jgi:hypothetical protein